MTSPPLFETHLPEAAYSRELDARSLESSTASALLQHNYTHGLTAPQRTHRRNFRLEERHPALPIRI